VPAPFGRGRIGAAHRWRPSRSRYFARHRPAAALDALVLPNRCLRHHRPNAGASKTCSGRVPVVVSTRRSDNGAGGGCQALYRTRTDDPFLTMEVLYQLS
jgi:hypothetical protein